MPRNTSQQSEKSVRCTNKVYEPSEEQIRLATAGIQNSWTDVERRRRLGCSEAKSVIPVYRESDFNIIENIDEIA